MFLNWINIGLGAFQAALPIIALAEGQGGTGDEKKKLVTSAVNAIVNTAVTATGGGGLTQQGNDILNSLTGIVTDSIVAFLNNIGQFQHTAEEPAKQVTLEVVK